MDEKTEREYMVRAAKNALINLVQIYAEIPQKNSHDTGMELWNDLYGRFLNFEEWAEKI